MRKYEALLLFSPELATDSRQEIQDNLNYYRTNAAVIAKALEDCGVWYCGGKNSPYIWMQCPDQMKSWEFFDYLLENLGIVGTPGSGFGSRGEGWFRLTAFASREATEEAAERLHKFL